MAKPTPDLLNLTSAEWSTISGPAGDKLFVSFVDHEKEHYTLLRDESNTILIYDQREWSAFIDGVVNGEFD